jgi:hypothetical protein
MSMLDKFVLNTKNLARQSNVGKQELFIRGPIPLKWCIKLNKIKNINAFRIASILWFFSGVHKSRRFKFCQKFCREKFGLRRESAYSGLKALEREGLITIDTNTGKNSIITIVDGQSLD